MYRRRRPVAWRGAGASVRPRSGLHGNERKRETNALVSRDACSHTDRASGYSVSVPGRPHPAGAPLSWGRRGLAHSVSSVGVVAGWTGRRLSRDPIGRAAGLRRACHGRLATSPAGRPGRPRRSRNWRRNAVMLPVGWSSRPRLIGWPAEPPAPPLAALGVVWPLIGCVAGAAGPVIGRAAQRAS